MRICWGAEIANIFLSYDRDDEARAQPIAIALERLGIGVWWDRQIKGGSEFGAEIEAALNAADKVVVLWSTGAVKSAWVRDEAAVGRDSGRLVPVTIDGTPAPLGFRQFQTIDLSTWGGRSRSKGFQDLIAAIDACGATPPASSPGLRRMRPNLERRQWFVLGSAALLLIALLIGGIWLSRSLGGANQPRIAIAWADTSGPSRQAARDLAIRIGNLGGTDQPSYELFEASEGSSAAADLVLKVGARSDAGKEYRDLALSASNGAILWSTSIEQSATDSAALPQQLAVKAQRVLSCGGEALSYRPERMRQEALKTYLSGCTNFDTAYGANVDNSDQARLFEQVIAQAPHFQPAWAKLLITEVDNLPSASDSSQLQRKIAAQVVQARKLGMDFAELYVGEAATLSPADFVGIFRTYDRGLKRHPDDAILHRSRGERFLYVGRLNDAVQDIARAVELDPLSPANQQTLASAYAYAGNTEAAYAQLKKAEQLWPGAPTVINARYRLDLRYGDPNEAMKLLQDPTLQGPLQSEQAAFIRARQNPTSENINRSIAEDLKIYRQYPDFISQIVQTLAQFGHKDEVLEILLHYGGGDQSGLAAEVLFRPALRDVWRDPRSIAAAKHLGLLHYWRVTGNWPDFCSDPTLPYDCRKEAAKYQT